MSISYSSLPASFRAEAEAYVNHGHRPSALLMAVLDDSLFSLLEAAPLSMEPQARQSLIVALAVWARVEAPAISRGSVLLTSRWMEQGGLQGRAAARAADQAMHAASTLARETVRQGMPHIRLVAAPNSAADTGPSAQFNAYTVADSIRRHGPLSAQ